MSFGKSTLVAFITLAMAASQVSAGYLGVHLKNYRGKGALVTRTTTSSPATRMICPSCSKFHELTPNVNVITAVNGKRVRNYTQAASALRSSDTNCVVRVLNLRHQTEREYRVTLEKNRPVSITNSTRNSTADDDWMVGDGYWNNWGQGAFGGGSDGDFSYPQFDGNAARRDLLYRQKNRNWSRNSDFRPVR